MVKVVTYLKKYKAVLRDYKEVFADIARDYHIPLAAVYADCIACRVFHGACTSNYVNFSMYKMNYREKKKYVTLYRSVKLEKLFNSRDREDRSTICNKYLFNQAFAEMVKRKWLYAPDHMDDEIKAFLQDREAVIVKAPMQARGEGVRKLELADIRQKGMDDFLHEVRQNKLLLEEVICQHPVLSAVNPSSVNTIRVATVRDKGGEVHIIGASLRAGSEGSFLDNLHAGGVQYPIDVESGCIIRGGVKHDGEKNILRHPSTGTKMIGLQIPNWDCVISTVKKAGKIPSKMRYIGWDVAITEEGCELIEANDQQGSNGMQQDGVGKYDFIMQYA